MDINVTKKQGVSVVLLIVIVCVVLIATGYILLKTGESVAPKDTTSPATFEEIVWETYENKKYDFSIEYPSHWKVSEDYSAEPVINFYPVGLSAELPITDFSGDIPHVSVYPLGLARGGINFRSENLNLPLENTSENSAEFVLENGASWARYIVFDNSVESWRPWGFIWAQLPTNNMEKFCITPAGKTKIEQCDPYLHEILTSGSVDKTENKVEVKILESFKFE